MVGELGLCLPSSVPVSVAAVTQWCQKKGAKSRYNLWHCRLFDGADGLSRAYLQLVINTTKTTEEHQQTLRVLCVQHVYVNKHTKKNKRQAYYITDLKKKKKKTIAGVHHTDCQ